MLRKTLIALVVAGASLSTVGAAVAADNGPQGSSDDAATVAAATGGEGVQRCNGGKHRRHQALISNVPLTWDETTSQVAIGSISFGVAKGTDLVEVDYNAEARLYGAADEGHWIQIDIYLDGTLMQPNDPVSPTTLADDDRGWESNATSVCARVGEGRHTIRAVATLVDFYGTASLTGWLDDWTLELDQYN
jgi:hypothetical protein